MQTVKEFPLIEMIGDFVCLNQKKNIEFEYLLAQKHKKLKEYYLCSNDISLDREKLRELYFELVIFGYTEMVKIFQLNEERIQNIFGKMRGAIGIPRITIKTIYKGEVLDIYRSKGESTFQLGRIDENSGFKEIVENDKKYYINNDIKSSFLAGEYINPRLEYDKKALLQKGEVEWKECWKPYKDTNENFYYTSTLIIPMSIRRDERDEKEFVDHFFTENKERMIWGFLCFDHEKGNYFKPENLMVDIGYIFADILSLYLIHFYNYITASKTVKVIKKYIS